MTPTRIALVYTALHLTGSLPRFHVELARHLASRGHDLHVFGIPRRSDPSLVPGAHFHAVDIRSGQREETASAAERIRFALAAQRELDRTDFDVVHVRAPSAWSGDLLHVPGIVRGEAKLMGLSRGRHAVSLLRHPQNLARNAIERRAIRHGGFRRFHAEAPLVRQHLERYYGIDPDRITVVVPGVNLDQFRPAADRDAMRKKIGLSMDSLVIVFCGHDFERKGLDIAIEAVAAARSAPELLVVGDIARAGEYRRLAARRGAAARVRFLGTRDDVQTIYAASDVFVLPTRADIWGATVLEAMACGVPPVVSTAAGVAGVVEPELEGIVLPAPVDPRSLRDAIDRLAADQGLRAAMGASAVRRAAQYGWDRHCAIVEEELLQLASEKRSLISAR